MTLTEAKKRFLRHCGLAVSLSANTLRAYTSDLDDALGYLGRRGKLESIRTEHLRGYIEYLRVQRRLKETTIKRRLASLKLFFKWVQRENLINEDPFDTLNERIRLPKRLPRALDRGDRESLRKALILCRGTDDFDAIRRKTAIHLLLDTGIRVGELVAIGLTDLSLASGSLIIHGKGNRQRLVYLLQKPLYRKMEKYLASRQSVQASSDRLFVSTVGRPISTVTVRAELRRISRAAGIARHVTPHMLRHTCATQWLEGGLDIRYVQKLLGHQSISTTEIYTHVSDQGLREALFRATGGFRR
ncbi:tyrosine-type recombinase/integrase [Paraburkholderia graminis]|uniref:tyrosine-type recombinase/integrase n=1 Tax=Paraburkholderia graminis TaxID=60548 RepID=UPI0027929BDE|nr:tyrosine-type recombinase/integrase [Paraburkholderia graminis]MDQ0625843.1 site-specific recombinase XerD [Paraburkholderia graminis]